MDQITWTATAIADDAIQAQVDELCARHLSAVGLGWSALLRQGFDRALRNGWDGRVVQIKEKFGGLRWYTEPAPDAVLRIVEAVEFASTFLCEFCGAAGRLRGKESGRRWLKTVCDGCQKTWEATLDKLDAWKDAGKDTS